jgi:hypothetical protein
MQVPFLRRSIKMAEKACEVLRNTKVQQVVQHGNRLVEIPYTATVNDALNTLLAKNILAVPVAAPPGQWIGAGGSMILESDKSTGAMRKQYIGMVSVLDILIHVAEDGEGDNLEERLTAQVSSIIGHSMEGLSLWSISPHTSYVFCSPPPSRLHFLSRCPEFNVKCRSWIYGFNNLSPKGSSFTLERLRAQRTKLCEPFHWRKGAAYACLFTLMHSTHDLST